MAGTREAIIEAAMRGFAEKGFEATGIREIAAAAGCNVAAISYHFGGKEGLRSACAGHIVAVMGKALAASGAADSAPEDAADASTDHRAEALGQLSAGIAVPATCSVDQSPSGARHAPSLL